MSKSPLLAQFRRALRTVPQLRQPLAVGAVTLLALTGAAEPARGQTVLPTWSNRLVVEPTPTGRKAMRMQLNVTDNVLYWVDVDGNPTVAPRTADALTRIDRADVETVGSGTERFQRVDPRDYAALAAEPVRVLLPPANPALAERMMRRAQAVLGGSVHLVVPPAGFARQDPSELGAVDPAQAAREAAAAAEAEREARAQGTLGHEVTQRAKDAGRGVVTGTVDQVVYEATDAVVNVVRRR